MSVVERNERFVIDERITVLENRLARHCRSDAEARRTRAELVDLKQRREMLLSLERRRAG